MFVPLISFFSSHFSSINIENKFSHVHKNIIKCYFYLLFSLLFHLHIQLPSILLFIPFLHSLFLFRLEFYFVLLNILICPCFTFFLPFFLSFFLSSFHSFYLSFFLSFYLFFFLIFFFISSFHLSTFRYALDAADHTSFSQLLPVPPASTAYLLPPDRFKFLSIPCKSEYLPAAVSYRRRK